MKLCISVVILILLCGIVAVSVHESEPLSLEDQNIHIVHLSFVAYKDGDWSLLAYLHSPAYIQHSPDSDGPVTWPEYDLACRVVRDRLPDLQFRILDIFASKDKVAVRSVWEYRNDSYQFKRHYPNGVAQGSEISIFRIKNGKIIEEWCESDPAVVKRFCRVYKSMEHKK